MTMHNPILEGSARAAFVDAWATVEEEAGISHGGMDLVDIAPKTSHEAKEWAWRLWENIFKLNRDRFPGFQIGGRHENVLANWIEAAWENAAESSGIDFHDSEEAENFGHYVAMQAMGAGVSWEDDHEAKGFKLPHFENTVMELDDREVNPDWVDIGRKARRGIHQVRDTAKSLHAGWRQEGVADETAQKLKRESNPRFKYSTEIQTLIFDHDTFTPGEAKTWAKRNGFKYSKVDEKENTVRLRQHSPSDYDRKTFRTINLTDGVKAVIGVPL